MYYFIPLDFHILVLALKIGKSTGYLNLMIDIELTLVKICNQALFKLALKIIKILNYYWLRMNIYKIPTRLEVATGMFEKVSKCQSGNIETERI